MFFIFFPENLLKELKRSLTAVNLHHFYTSFNKHIYVCGCCGFPRDTPKKRRKRSLQLCIDNNIIELCVKSGC